MTMKPILAAALAIPGSPVLADSGAIGRGFALIGGEAVLLRDLGLGGLSGFALTPPL